VGICGVLVSNMPHELKMIIRNNNIKITGIFFRPLSCDG